MRFGEEIEDVYPEALKSLATRGWLVRDNGACRLTDDLDRWNKHPLQRAMEKFVSSKSANYVNSPFSEDTPGRG